MNPIEAIKDHLREGLTPYPAEEFGRTVAQLGDAVLWSGRTKLPDGIEQNLATSAYAYVAGTALLAVFLVALAVFALRRFQGNPISNRGGFAYLFAIGIPLVGGLIGMMNGRAHWDSANAASSGAVILTANRVIEFGVFGRDEIPATAVTRVSRREDSTRLGLADRGAIVIETSPSERADLDGAIRKVVEAVGSGARIIKDRLG